MVFYLCHLDVRPWHVEKNLGGGVIFGYLLSLPVAHLSDTPRRQLVVTGDSARIQDEITENSTWFFNVLSVEHHHTGPRFDVSSERL